jgi:hypothetical protein
MTNLQGQITFYELVKEADGEDESEYAGEIRERLGELYREFDGAKAEFDELDTHVSNLNFERFQREQKEQEEDEAAFKADAGRAEEAKAEFDARMTEIETALKTAQGADKTALETEKT